MSKPGTIYRLETQNAERLSDQQTFDSQLLIIEIADWDNLIPDEEEATVIDATCAGAPVEFSTIDNSEDTFTVIRSTQLTMKILTEATINLSTFASGSAQRWGVHAYINIGLGYTVFRGWLVNADMSESFMPHPHELTLVANDGLGLLKDIPLTDLVSDNPTGYNTIAEYLTWALSKTGLTLDMRVINNITPGSGEYTRQSLFSVSGQYIAVSSGVQIPYFYPGQEITITGTVSNNGTFHVVSSNFLGGVTEVYIEETITVPESGVTATYTDTLSANHLYSGCFLDAKTFEEEINISENCYSAIEKILGESCSLFQRTGEWWIVRVDELEVGDVYVSTFNTAGGLQTHFQPYEFSKEIGKDSHVVFFSNEATRVGVDMRHREVKLTYNYTTPLELPCNIDFERGDLVTTVSDYDKHYELDCWTMQKGSVLTPPGSPDSTVYIRRIFNDLNYEDERYIVITPAAANAGSDSLMQYIISEPIYISEKDRFSTSVDWRVPTSFGSNGGILILFRAILKGDDGSWWILGNSTIFPTSYNETGYKWWDTTVWTANTGAGATDIDGSLLEETEWNPINWEAPPAPVSGKVYLMLSQFNQDVSSWDNINVHYSNLTFDYNPYINGSYQKYEGQQHLISQNINNKITREKDVYISDSPRKLFKGALHFFSDPDYLLTKTFFDAARYPTGIPDMAGILPYGEIQAFDVWNQHRLEMRVFDAEAQGLDSAATDPLSKSDMISLLQTYLLVDANDNTDDRVFRLMTDSIYWDSCSWRGVLREVYNSVQGKSLGEGHTFKYIENG